MIDLEIKVQVGMTKEGVLLFIKEREQKAYYEYMERKKLYGEESWVTGALAQRWYAISELLDDIKENEQETIDKEEMEEY